jgi:hypothetical protein
MYVITTLLLQEVLRGVVAMTSLRLIVISICMN